MNSQLAEAQQTIFEIETLLKNYQISDTAQFRQARTTFRAMFYGNCFSADLFEKMNKILVHELSLTKHLIEKAKLHGVY